VGYGVIGDMGISLFGYLDIAKPLARLCIPTRGYCYTRDYDPSSDTPEISATIGIWLLSLI
jgi:hypothetical protein